MLCRWWEVQCLSVVSFQGGTVSECCVVLREVQCGGVVLLLKCTVLSMC